MAEILHERLRENANDLSAALTELSTMYFAPHDVKVMREFSSSEVTDLLKVSEGYLRKARHEGRIPDYPAGPNGKRSYTLEQIWEMRNLLAKGAKNPYQMLPGRREGDKLQVWSVVNFKGGSGKTAANSMVSMRLALLGYRVLAIDSDAQASLTTYFGYQPEVDFLEGGTLYDAIRYRGSDGSGPVPLSKVIRKTFCHNLDLVPGGILLAEFEHETPAALSRLEQPIFYQKISQALAEVEGQYDIVLIDCPPQLGYLTLSAVAASTSVLMTVIPEKVDIASLAQFLKMASGLMEVISENGAVGSYDNILYLLSRYDTSISTQVDLAEYLRSLFPGQVLKAPLLKSSAISEASLSQKTIFETVPTNTNRRTHDRALKSVTEVSNEIEGYIQRAWGRSVDEA